MTIGADLLEALFELAREQGVERLEVGLPSERFPQPERHRGVLRQQRLHPIGTRMRRICSE